MKKMRGMRLTGDTGGRVRDVLVNYDAQLREFIPELISELNTKARIHIAYGYTQDEIAKKLEEGGLRCVQEGNGKYLNILMRMDPTLYPLFASPRLGQKLVQRMDLSGMEKEGMSDVLDFYTRNETFQEIVNYTAAGIGRGKELSTREEDMKEIESVGPGRVRAFKIDGALSPFSRDRILGGTREGKRVLVQGKIDWQGEKPNCNGWRYGNDLKIPEHPYWDGLFEMVPNREVEALLYEGGDMRLSERWVFIGYDTVKNNSVYGKRRKSVENVFRELTGRDRCFVFPEMRGTPVQHIDLFFSPVDDRLVLLGDMRPTLTVLGKVGLVDERHADAYKGMQPWLNQAAVKLKKEGFLVRRIPLYGSWLMGEKGMDLRSYANEVRDRKTLLVAGFGIEELDRESTKAWEGAGYSVHVTDKLGSVQEFIRAERLSYTFKAAGVRCVVNVLARR